MDDLIFTDPAEPNKDDLASLADGLRSYNDAAVGKHRKKAVAVFVKNKQGKVLAGVYGDIGWGWLHVDRLWCDESLRGQGIGSRLMTNIENYALTQGISNFRLETADFQALDFYLKIGYEVFGQLPDMPLGNNCYFLKKQL